MIDLSAMDDKDRLELAKRVADNFDRGGVRKLVESCLAEAFENELESAEGLAELMFRNGLCPVCHGERYFDVEIYTGTPLTGPRYRRENCPVCNAKE